MAEIVWKVIRWCLPIDSVLIAIWMWYMTGFSLITWILIASSLILVFTYPFWSEVWIRKLELPAYRKEAREYASIGIVGVLFLRPFSIDSQWSQLQTLVNDMVRAYNSKYAAFQTVVGVGGADHGEIAKIGSMDDHGWWTRVQKLSKDAQVIVILPIHSHLSPTAGIVKEITHVIVNYLDKTIFMMPPVKTWDARFQSTSLSGRLEQLWSEMVDKLAKTSPLLTLPPFRPEGCFFTIDRNEYGDKTKYYPYSDEGAADVLWRVMDNERVKRDLFVMKYDPEGYTRRMIALELGQSPHSIDRLK